MKEKLNQKAFLYHLYKEKANKINRSYPKYLRSPEEIIDLFSGKTILVFDTETTGLYSQTHQVTEIAAGVFNGDSFRTIDSFHRKIVLTERTLARIDYEKENPPRFGVKKCLDMQNYDPNSSDLIELDSALIDFYQFCEKYNAIIVGQNIKFDLDMVNTALKKVKPGAQLKHKDVLDTKLFFTLYIIPAFIALRGRGNSEATFILRKIWDWKIKRPSAKLDSILKAFDIEIKGWHGAFADVKSTAIALLKIRDFIKKHSDIVTDPIFIKERNIAYKREHIFYRKKSKRERKNFYKKDKLS